jgi:succinate-acetate transporter protein
MEAATPGAPGARAREADIAPAPEPAARAVGWSPADPGPLGLAAFATTTFMLSMFNSHLVREGGLISMISVALAYGGIAQILAGMWEFRTGNTFGAVVFTSYGAFWISFFVLVRVVPAALLQPHAISVYLYGWAIFTLLMLVASLRTTGVVAVVFVLLTITFFLLAIGWANLPSSSGTDWIKWGGYFGLATAVAAWYGAFAATVNSTFGRVLVPVFPLKR